MVQISEEVVAEVIPIEAGAFQQRCKPGGSSNQLTEKAMNRKSGKTSSNGDESFEVSRSEAATKFLLDATVQQHEGNVSENHFVRNGKKLKKSLSLKHAFASIVSMLLGSGIFISPSLIARQTSNMGMVLVVWIVAGFFSLFGALCYCELACMYKKTGSSYLFILEAYGEVVGFMVLWMEVIIMNPTGFSILSLTVGEHIIGPIPNLDSYSRIWLAKLVAILMAFLTATVNCISTAFVGKTQIFFTAIQSLSALFIVALGIGQVASGHVENYTVMFNNTENFSIGSFGLALYNALWAYDGWASATSIAEELNSLETNLWLAFVTGIPFVIVCFLCISLALVSALTRNEIMNSDTVATVFVAKVLGTKASYTIPVAVALSCIGSMIGTIFTHGRTYLSAAREGQLPSVFLLIHKDRRTPIPGLLFVCLMTTAWLLPSSNGLEKLITYFSIAVWFKYALAIFSVLLMRKRRPDLERPFKVWIANPIITGLFSLFLVGIPFVKRPIESTICLLLFLTALPIYYIFIKKYESLPPLIRKISDALNLFLIQKCSLAPCVFEEAASNADADEMESPLDTKL